MASHHHCHQPTPIPTANSTYTSCYCATTTPTHPPSIDPNLLQSLISLVQTSSQNPNPNPYCHCDPHSNRRHQTPPKDPIFSPHNSPLQQDVLVSLINRIDALEASLRRRESYIGGSSSVREAAALVIQLHFRAYLVSRSRSLRHLKDLAFIKSKFNALKSSVSDHSRFDPVVVSRRTVELLYKVDSIQDRDPMIVNGKKSLTRDLVGFLDYVDAIAVKRRGVLARAVKKVSVFQTRGDRRKPLGLEPDFRGVGRDRRVGIETRLYEDVDGEYENVEEVSSEEEIPYVSPRDMNKKSTEIRKGNLGGKRKLKKNVSFADDGRNRNVISSICKPSSKPSAGSNGTGDVKGILESLKKRVEEMEAGMASGVPDEEDEESESGVSAQTSDGENLGTTSAINTNQKTTHQHFRDEDDDEFTFPAPEHLNLDTKVEPANKNLKIKS